MPKREPGAWDDSTALARAILHDRTERRKWLGRMIIVPLAMMAVGLWVIDGWLGGSPWRFLIWWGACAVATCVVLVFALYDALAAIREEREKHK